jgi:hypothetical protein
MVLFKATVAGSYMALGRGRARLSNAKWTGLVWKAYMTLIIENWDGEWSPHIILGCMF